MKKNNKKGITGCIAAIVVLVIASSYGKEGTNAADIDKRIAAQKKEMKSKKTGKVTRS